ncbi:MAG: Zn-dependent hydrolase, glyoxylase [Burkholderiaceae bacterium]|nr:Zn-dependent hydrolase, glyoxylase [Burkholderiaceae bacterium]
MQHMPLPFAHPFIRHLLRCVTALLLCLAPLAQAEAPQQQKQVPGYYRTMLGKIEVTALFDGAFQLDVARLKNARPEDIRQLLARMFVDTKKMQTAVNTYLINTGRHLVLVDAGGGSLYGPTVGKMLANLKTSGYAPEQVDAVIVTHMHGDHIAGLTDAAGRATFPNATVFVAKEDNDYWLSDKVAAASPASWKRIFDGAKNTAAPYLAQNRWQTFTPGTQLVPGITAVDAHGHTPGHTAFAIESGSQRLLIWGDVVHNHAVQFKRPDVTFDFDVDPKQALATRLEIFKKVAKSGELVAGMHLPFPGIGRVRADGNGQYSWVPIEFSPLGTK